MKLLLENWKKFLNENKSWRDTSWETDEEKVTLGQIDDFLGDETVDLNVLELYNQIPSLPTRGEERVKAASLEFPIIVVRKGGKFKYVLDGNHRLQKAINQKVETIKAKILDLDSPDTPKTFKKMFGGAE
jgi:uncharacterized ParB-like nuclease family protein